MILIESIGNGCESNFNHVHDTFCLEWRREINFFLSSRTVTNWNRGTLYLPDFWTHNLSFSSFYFKVCRVPHDVLIHLFDKIIFSWNFFFENWIIEIFCGGSRDNVVIWVNTLFLLWISWNHYQLYKFWTSSFYFQMIILFLTCNFKESGKSKH